METTTLSTKLRKTVKGAARNLGVSENDLVTKAVLFYLAAVKKNVHLRDELRMWETASIEDLTSFEKALP
jgi:hypothetical protein